MAAFIYPESFLPRTQREQRLGQRSRVVWLTGLSGSGKSTLARTLELALFQQGFFAQVLDGDNLRNGLNAGLGFSPADRLENLRRVAEVAKLYLHSGIVTIAAFISPSLDQRQLVRQIIGEEDFLEIWVKASLPTCEARDVKGLYQKARAGLLPDFTGVHQAYEPPAQPALILDTEQYDLSTCTAQLLDFVRQSILL